MNKRRQTPLLSKSNQKNYMQNASNFIRKKEKTRETKQKEKQENSDVKVVRYY